MFKIEIKNIKTKARIGITDKERKKFQPLLVTINFKYTILKKNNLEEIKFLKDYSSIIKFLKVFIENSNYKSLEKLTHESSCVLEKKFRINKVYISINKINVALRYGCESISVSK